jgi:hypothetical protein
MNRRPGGPKRRELRAFRAKRRERRRLVKALRLLGFDKAKIGEAIHLGKVGGRP